MNRIVKLHCWFFVLIFFFNLVPVTGFCEQKEWVTKADIVVNQTGIVETTLLPGLHYKLPKEKICGMSLELFGPDENLRSCELYWKERTGAAKTILKADKIELSDSFALIWEGILPEKFKTDKIRIEIADKNGVGKVDVEGLGKDGWSWLIRNAALYTEGLFVQTEINIKPDEYQKIRLHFSGYDKQYEKTPFPVRQVTAFGEYIKKDFIEKDIQLEFSTIQKEDGVYLKAMLPGSGLMINDIEITTDAQFQGEWQLGNEILISGKQQFKAVKNGKVSAVGSGRTFSIPYKQVWERASLVLRIDPKGRYVGQILNLKAHVQLPRLVFFADQIGTYTVKTGLDKCLQIFHTPGDPKRKIHHELKFMPVQKNLNWRPENLAKKFNIQGGPFDVSGYTWKSPINIQTPGYYKLVLNQQASLEKYQDCLRLVKDNMQTPFFFGHKELNKVVMEFDKTYDEKENRTIWIVNLPQSSQNWVSLRLTSEGIFERQLLFEKNKHGNIGWEKWTQRVWRNNKKEHTELSIDLKRFPKDQTKIRITMEHKDNRPLELNSIEASYLSRTLMFIASQAGKYELWGGNPNIPFPSYDLALVKNQLLDNKPLTVEMGEIIEFRSSGLKDQIYDAFSNQGWGLYIVLSMTTLILLILIVRLFPKEEK